MLSGNYSTVSPHPRAHPNLTFITRLCHRGEQAPARVFMADTAGQNGQEASVDGQLRSRTAETEDGAMSATAARLFRVVVVGLGIAGRARVRDIPRMAPTVKGLEHVSLAGYVSRSVDHRAPKCDVIILIPAPATLSLAPSHLFCIAF